MIDQGGTGAGVRLLRATLMLLMRILFRIEHRGLERVPPAGPLVLVSNHVTYFDPFWVATPIRRTTRFMAWDRIFRIPVAGRIFSWLGAFPVSLENPEAGAYKTALQILGRGEALVLFPEGGRSPDGRLLPFKEGAARLALRTRAWIMPVAVFGGVRVWSPAMRLPRPCKVRVEYLDPIPAEQLGDSARMLTLKLRSILAEHVEAKPPSAATPA